MPGFNLADALGYDSAQLDLIKSHEADIWNTLIAKRLLFSTVATVADRLVNPAPYTSIIGHVSYNKTDIIAVYNISLMINRL